MRRLYPTLLLLSATCCGCVEVNRGAVVAINLRAANAAEAGEHYQLFAEINGSAAPIVRFKVLSPIDDCGQDPNLVLDIGLVQRYEVGITLEELCSLERRLGAIDGVNLAEGSNVGGIRINTKVDLSDATAVFVTVEPDDDADARAGRPWISAELGRGVAPDFEVQAECLDAFCATLDPDDPADAMVLETTCAERPEAPRKRRGVLAGVFVQQPVTDICLAPRPGLISVVPAVDDTFL